MVFKESSGYLKGLKFIVCTHCGKRGVKWMFTKEGKFKQCRYCRARSEVEKICPICGKKTKIIVKETGVCMKCHLNLLKQSGGIYSDFHKGYQ